MKSQTLILIFSVILGFQVFSQTIADTISLNTDRVIIEKFPDSWKIRFLCTSRIGFCTFEYVLLPTNWVVEGQQIRIPLEDTTKTRTYFMQVVISEPTGQNVEKDIVLFFHDGQIDVTARDKPTQKEVVEVRQEEDSVSQESSNFRPKNRQDLSWLEENGITPYIPSVALLNEVVLEKDILEFSQLIQYIISDKSDCAQKIQYLRQVANSLDQHIFNTQNQLQKQRGTINIAQEELQRLNTQKQNLVEEIARAKSQDKESLKKMEKELYEERRIEYSKFYRFNIIATQYKRKFDANSGTSGANASSTAQIQKQIETDELELKKLNEEIEKIMKKKEEVEERLTENRRKVKDRTVIGTVSPTTIQNLQKNYKRYESLAAEAKMKYDIADEKLQKIQQDLEGEESNIDELQKQLKELQAKIEETQKHNQGASSIQETQDFLEALQRNTPNVKKSLKDCEESEAQKQEAKTVVVANIRPTQVIDDLENTEIPPLSKFEPLFPALLQVNIFSSEWVVNYGVPKTTNFNCNVKKNPTQGYGIITGIKNATIRIRDEDGKIMGLDLGVCTEVYAMRSNFVPEAGDLIDWEGDSISSIVANVHVARIFRDK